MRNILWILAVSLLAPAALAAVKTEVVEYRDGDTLCRGYLAFDDAQTDARPGVLLVHDWWGLGELVKTNAERLAALGYVAFAVDMYGEGALTTKMEEASARSSAIKGDPALMQRRFEAGLQALLDNPNVDPARIGAMGYCFGGTVSLEMARAGLDLRGVVSFHGGLKSALPAEQRKIKARVLACHGANDGFVPAEEVAAFEQEMRDAQADWLLVSYGNAVHSFTDPGVDKHGMEMAKYNEKAANRSWAHMRSFFEEVFAK